ncbi:MAG TPA: hypothetical protein VFX92_07430 [Candidatus Krumholzibacteria bacterium]|nr:hypothetical protein [Candidatus Krumholzibacteria bacterium]
MYVGHFAAGLALKTAEPKAPTWGILVGVGLLDILFGPFVLLGIERATVTPGVSPGFSLDFIDWSHSLVMSLVWAALFALFFLRRGRPVATVMGIAVFSHFLLDVPMHPADMALWPHSATHIGFGLWRALPTGFWFVELAVIAAGWGYYAWRSRGSSEYGGRPVAIAIALLALHLFNSPWFSRL